MKKNNPKVTLSDKSKAFYRRLMFDIMAIEMCYGKKNKVIKIAPQLENQFWEMHTN